MAYTTYDKPGEFFNASPTTAGLSVGTGTITLGTFSHGTAANRFLTNVTDTDSNLTTGSTAQMIFGITDSIYQRFNSIVTADKPTKFNITRTGYTDETTGELVYNYAITCRVTPGSLVAVNS